MKNPWQRLRELLEEEREAILSGDVSRLLDCVKAKEQLLKTPELKEAPLPVELREEIKLLTERNQMLLEAGLAFIEEAYRFLAHHLAPKLGYEACGRKKKAREARLISVQV